MNGPSRVRMGGGGRKMRPRAFWPPSPPNRWLPASLYCLALASKAPQFKACHAPLCPKLGEHEEEGGGKGGFEASESSGREWWTGNGEKFWEWKGAPQCSIHPLHVSNVHVKCRTNAYLHLFSAKESITLQFLPKSWDYQICTSEGCNQTKGLMLRKLRCS